MKFDIIIGNPPYQRQDAGDSTGASPIYHHFVEQARKLSPRYISMIIPSRWFSGGKGLDRFRKSMLADRRISHLVDYLDAADCFPGVEIKGGVCYFLWDAKHNDDCEVATIAKNRKTKPLKRNLDEYDVLVRFNEAVSILNRVVGAKDGSFAENISSSKPFGLRTNFRDFSTKPSKGYVKIFANKAVGWVNGKEIVSNHDWIAKYKVLVSSAYNGGDNLPHQIIGRPIIAEPNSCCTETYLVCGLADSMASASLIEAYMKTRFFRFLVSIRKISQHNPKDRFAFVPAVPMTQIWTDEALYERYALSSDEIDFIESMVKEIL